MRVVGVVAVNFVMVESSCALGVIVNLDSALVITREVVLKSVEFNVLAFLVT